ncbi:hypothetical protein Ciccas_012060, partial [Cichlidogyrus casuarinus]
MAFYLNLPRNAKQIDRETVKVFSCTKDIKIVQVRWHPLFTSHLFVLTSDNVLTIVPINRAMQNCVECGKKEEINLQKFFGYNSDENDSDQESFSIPGKMNLSSAMGCKAVDFDFGSVNSSAKASHALQCSSVYLLCSNGDLYLISMKNNRITSQNLSILSADFDDLSEDFSSILCLQFSEFGLEFEDEARDILVLGDCSGKLFHGL